MMHEGGEGREEAHVSRRVRAEDSTRNVPRAATARRSARARAAGAPERGFFEGTHLQKAGLKRRQDSVHVAVLRREVARALLQRLDGPLVRVEVRDEGLVLRAEVHRVRGRPLASPVLLLDPPPLFRRHRNRGERGGAQPSHSGASGRGCAALGARVPGLGGGGRKRVGEGKCVSAQFRHLSCPPHRPAASSAAPRGALRVLSSTVLRDASTPFFFSPPVPGR